MWGRALTPTSGNMTSFNHYALGAVANFMHAVVGGLSPLEPGWAKIQIKPRPGGNLTFAKTSFKSPYGLAKCEWKIEGEKLKVEATVPLGCTADVELPGGTTQSVGSGVWEFEEDWVADERFPPELVQPEFCRPVDKDWVR